MAARHRISIVMFFAALTGSCAALTPEGSRVAVYRAPLTRQPPQRAMPDGCRVVATKPRVSMAELDLEGQKGPFRKERNEAGAAGANVLLIRSRRTIGRRNLDCPSSLPITDCPPSFGAWFDVVVESYSCTPAAVRELSNAPSTMLPENFAKEQ